MRLRGFGLGLAMIVGGGVGLAGCDDFQAPRASSPAPRPPASRPAPALAERAVRSPAPTPPPLKTASAAAAGAVEPAAEAIDAAAFAPVQTPTDRRNTLIRAQVLLDRAHFSPGVIDGRDGSNFRLAVAAFVAARGLPSAAPGAGPGAPLDPGAWNALTAADGGPVTQDYAITADDVKGPFLGTVPDKMAGLAELKYVGYANPAEGLAEKFHMDEGLLRALNPKADFAKVGATIVVTRPAGDPLPPVSRIEVDKKADQLRAYDAAGRIEAVFPATVGSTERPAPSGAWAVRAVAPRPDYTYDPSRLTFGDKTQGKLTIPPGPNNPVGSTWIDLTVPTYGIHGAPDPTLVGKAASHGCVRLTNWDAAALGKAVKKGVPVIFMGTARRKATG